MKHWDLKPGELVTLVRGRDDQTENLEGGWKGKPAVFRFHTTRLCCFETIDLDPDAPPRLLQFEACDDGSLIELPEIGFKKRWHVVGPDRHTRTVAREPFGQKPHFTMGERGIKAALAKGAGV